MQKLVIKDLRKNFENKEVLNGASKTFEKGKIYGLIGRNGAGKTTFFNCINEDIPKDGGEIVLEEDGQTRNLTSDDIGYVLSTPEVPEFLTAREFLKFVYEINCDKIGETRILREDGTYIGSGYSEKEKKRRILDDYFDWVKIDQEDRDRLLKDFSHGMKNKMQMLIQFMLNPTVLLLDEPLTSLDVVVADEMKNLLRQMKKDHIIIFSTHIMDLALDLCDDIVILNQGQLQDVEKENLNHGEYKDKIISMLKGETKDE